MIISYKHNYIFIKTKKTAGTAVEMNIAPTCGPDDVITELGNKEELVRGNGVPLCRNFAPQTIVNQVHTVILMGKAASMEKPPRRENKFWNHMRAVEVKPLVEPDFWDKAFKFTIERHPYEKAVSLAFFRYKPHMAMTFEECLSETVKGGGYKGWNYYTIDDKVVVDEILRTESIRDDLKRVGEKLGFEVPDELMRAKTKRRTDRRPASEILSEGQKKTVFRHCEEEFELLGYKP